MYLYSFDEIYKIYIKYIQIILKPFTSLQIYFFQYYTYKQQHLRTTYLQIVTFYSILILLIIIFFIAYILLRTLSDGHEKRTRINHDILLI